MYRRGHSRASTADLLQSTKHQLIPRVPSSLFCEFGYLYVFYSSSICPGIRMERDR